MLRKKTPLTYSNGKPIEEVSVVFTTESDKRYGTVK